MLTRYLITACLIFASVVECHAQDEKPEELKALRSYAGVWDAEFQVWFQGLDADPIKFKGVETNRLFGEHWMASDLVSEFMGQSTKVHSIIGYDRDEKKMVGTVIDSGPYSATMTGEYDKDTKTLTWMTKAKMPNGDPITQKTLITQKNENERELVLMVPGANDEFKKFMKITFVKRKSE